MEEENEPKSFSEDYVQKLRNESAERRSTIKALNAELDGYKGLEGQITQLRVENELVRRGLNIDPDFIKILDGVTPAAAVDNFLEKYPQFLTPATESVQPIQPQAPQLPQAMPPVPGQANQKGPPARGTVAGRMSAEEMERIKEDPIARKTLRNNYLNHMGYDTDY